MTGFGKAEGNVADKIISIEIKSLNSKGLDMNIRMPGFLREKEIPLRNLIAEHIKRGKIDVYFNLELPANKKIHTINEQMAKTYAAGIQAMAKEFGEEVNNVSELVLRMPNVLEPIQEEITDEEWKGMEAVALEAIERVNAFRAREGVDVEQVFTNAIDNIEQHLGALQEYEPERALRVREKLTKQLEAIDTEIEIDQNRLEQEIIYYIEKFDISEEKSRLTTHIEHFRKLLVENGFLKGKKLGFVAQELGREINTIGSKANHAEIQRHVVRMKDNLEQIKEQIANVL